MGIVWVRGPIAGGPWNSHCKRGHYGQFLSHRRAPFLKISDSINASWWLRWKWSKTWNENRTKLIYTPENQPKITQLKRKIIFQTTIVGCNMFIFQGVMLWWFFGCPSTTQVLLVHPTTRMGLISVALFVADPHCLRKRLVTHGFLGWKFHEHEFQRS